MALHHSKDRAAVPRRGANHQHSIIGLIVFLGMHSTRIVADGWRTAQLKRLGEGTWKGIYSLIWLAGFGLIFWGFGRRGSSRSCSGPRPSPCAMWRRS